MTKKGEIAAGTESVIWLLLLWCGEMIRFVHSSIRDRFFLIS